jgi:heme-degrading monooxygenase HmoA
MIARVWTGVTPGTKSDRYLEYLEKTGVKECRATPGNRGVYVLRRVADGRAEFLFISLWESLEAIGAFAGADIDKAVYFPEDRDFLLEMDPHVRHYEVAGRPASRGRNDPAC